MILFLVPSALLTALVAGMILAPLRSRGERRLVEEYLKSATDGEDR